MLAGNVANVDTPGFQPKDLDFAKAMAAAQRPRLDSGTGPAGSGFDQIHESSDFTSAVGIDGNAVDLDRTMVALAENALTYGAVTRAASKKLSMLRYVASDGNS